MNTQQVADKLVGFCRQGQFETAQNELFTEDAWSHEPEGMDGTVQGRDKIVAKGKQWMDTVAEHHGLTVSDAVVAGNRFAVALNMDVTYKNGERMPMEELCIYDVKDGKIVSERFIY